MKLGVRNDMLMNKRLRISEHTHLSIPWTQGIQMYVMLEDKMQQKQLMQMLYELCPRANIEDFYSKEKLMEQIRKKAPQVTFLSERYGMVSGLGIGKQLQKECPVTSNIIYLSNTKDVDVLKRIWEMHISGILIWPFDHEDLADELYNLRVPFTNGMTSMK